MATSGQTLNDRINAARYALAGQGLARCVCKATTEEVIGPKRKHLDYLLACTHEPNVSIPQLANLLIERTNHIYWVVVFKALVTVHNLMSYGNERFTQYLASSNYSFELSTFLDKTSARDFSMSTFIRRYSRYINEKALSYRLLAFDLCKVKRGNEGVLRLMPIDRLLKTLPILQNQLDVLLEFDCSANDINNGVSTACFNLLFKDLIGLFACHNDGIINLLNKYFTLNRKMCREAFDLYKKFLVRMDKVSEFLQVAEQVGVGKEEIPDLRRAPSSLIDALEQHLQNIESNKKILKQQASVSGGIGKSSGNLAVGDAALALPLSRRSNSPSNTGGSQTTGGSQGDEFLLTSFKDEEVRKALEEEARVLSKYGVDGTKNKSSSGAGASISIATNGSHDTSNSPKFAVSTVPKSIDDIFGDVDSFSCATNNNLDNNNTTTSAFDNLSSASSSSSSVKQTRPDLDSIKSAIQSATTTLEKSNSTKAAGDSKPAASKKASDELFSLLGASVQPQAVASQPSTLLNQQPSSTLLGGAPMVSTLMNSNNNMSPFASTASPFDMPTNGPSNGQLPILKPGNPFPEISSEFTTSGPTAFRHAFSAIDNPTSGLSTQLSSASVFKSGGGSSNAANFSTTKSSFNTGSGLSSTGLFKGDLDSTLANLAQNLTFEGLNKTKK